LLTLRLEEVRFTRITLLQNGQQGQWKENSQLLRYNGTEIITAQIASPELNPNLDKKRHFI